MSDPVAFSRSRRLAAIAVCVATAAVGAPSGARSLWRTASKASVGIAPDAPDNPGPYAVTTLFGLEARREALRDAPFRRRLRTLAPLSGRLFETLAATSADTSVFVALPADALMATQVELAATYFFPRRFVTVFKDPETWAATVDALEASLRARASDAPLIFVDLGEPRTSPSPDLATPLIADPVFGAWRIR
jgi:hypothetical protein